MTTPMSPEVFDMIVQALATALVDDVQRNPSGSFSGPSATTSAEPLFDRRMALRVRELLVDLAHDDEQGDELRRIPYVERR